MRSKVNLAQLTGILRTLLAAFSGYLLANKQINIAPFITPEVVEALASLLLGVIGLWSVQSKTKTNRK